MIQQRQIAKTLGKQIKDVVYSRSTIIRFHYFDWLIISVNVTINRTVPLPRYQSSSSAHCI